MVFWRGLEERETEDRARNAATSSGAQEEKTHEIFTGLPEEDHRICFYEYKVETAYCGCVYLCFSPSEVFARPLHQATVTCVMVI